MKKMFLVIVMVVMMMLTTSVVMAKEKLEMDSKEFYETTEEVRKEFYQIKEDYKEFIKDVKFRTRYTDKNNFAVIFEIKTALGSKYEFDDYIINGEETWYCTINNIHYDKDALENIYFDERDSFYNHVK